MFTFPVIIDALEIVTMFANPDFWDSIQIRRWNRDEGTQGDGSLKLGIEAVMGRGGPFHGFLELLVFPGVKRGGRPLVRLDVKFAIQ